MEFDLTLVILIMVLNFSSTLILRNLQYPLADPPLIVMTETGRSLERFMHILVNVLIVANIVLIFFTTWWIPIVAYIVCTLLPTGTQKWKSNFLFAQFFSVIGIVDLILIVRYVIEHRV
jgi:hypothetical protein